MPNWCSNWIEITGNKRQISIIKNAVESIENEEESSVFRTLVGIEPNVNLEEYDGGKWYDSNVSHWGTKWDVAFCECNFEFGETSITMSPQTAWSPPIGFGANLSRMYGVEVVLTYSEPGCNFAGRTTITPDGGVSEEDYSYMEGTYVFDNETFWFEVDSDLEYYFEGSDEDMTAENYVRESYSFVSEEDVNRLIEMFNEKKKEYEDSCKENQNQID